VSDPTNVVEALAAVMRDLPGIGKGGQAAAQQGGYKYRGIEQITAEVQKLFAKYGIITVPRVKHRRVEDIEVNGKPWTDTYLEVDWDIYSSAKPGGRDMIQASTFGHGRDNSDKGTNKAMTQAFKYLLLDMLCISDPADDNDGTNQAADARRTTGTSFSAPQADPGYEEVNGEQIPNTPPMETTRSGPPSDLATPKQRGYVMKLLDEAGIGDGDAFEAWFKINIPVPYPGSVNNLTKAHAGAIIELLK